MPIIGKVGRKEFRVRLLNIGIHAVLMLGAVTMIYPFLIMISGSFKSRVDSTVFNILPRFFYDDNMLFKKYIESRFNETSSLLSALYRDRFMSFDFVESPERPNRESFDDWMAFLAETGEEHTEFDFYLNEMAARGMFPRNQRKFRNIIKAESDNDITRVNAKYQTAYLTWDEIAVNQADILSRKFLGYNSGILGRYRDFLLQAPLWERIYASIDGDFYVNELKPAYMGDLAKMNQALGTHYNSWNEVAISRTLPSGPMAKHWKEYVKHRLNIHCIRVKPDATGLYRGYLKKKYGTIAFLNRNYHANYASFEAIPLPSHKDLTGTAVMDWAHFIENIVPAKFLEIDSIEFRFRAWLKKKYGNIDTLNQKYRRGLSAFAEAGLPGQAPSANLRKQTDWYNFVRAKAVVSSLSLKMSVQGEYLRFLSGLFPGTDHGIDVNRVNAAYNTKFDKAIDIYPARSVPPESMARNRKDWLDFVRKHASAKFILLAAKPNLAAWHEFLSGVYDNDISRLNRAWGMTYSDFAHINIDYWNHDYFIFQQHKSTIFWEFVKRNYVMVVDVMLVNGSAILNTIIYCALMIGVALLVNPLAAYGMSRFKLPNTYKIILLLMLTMAFPPMVMGIPNFILLKKLGLLNTFFALVLPVAANGYFIFLLKGFFDSLPQELFESATIDGASEWQIFWTIAMSLSKPIMAVIALNAFNAAYRNFMLAFIVCQDQSMWTLMVHIYQLIQRSATGVGFAALVVASIPTFLVFVFCQNIIIRGIVVPTEK